MPANDIFNLNTHLARHHVMLKPKLSIITWVKRKASHSINHGVCPVLSMTALSACGLLPLTGCHCLCGHTSCIKTSSFSHLNYFITGLLTWTAKAHSYMSSQALDKSKQTVAKIGPTVVKKQSRKDECAWHVELCVEKRNGYRKPVISMWQIYI